MLQGAANLFERHTVAHIFTEYNRIMVERATTAEFPPYGDTCAPPLQYTRHSSHLFASPFSLLHALAC